MFTIRDIKGFSSIFIYYLVCHFQLLFPVHFSFWGVKISLQITFPLVLRAHDSWIPPKVTCLVACPIASAVHEEEDLDSTVVKPNCPNA